MSSNTVKSVDDLIRKVKKDIAKKLNEERSQTKIKNVNRRHVAEEVYEAYKPFKYPRRADDGGLTDEDNILVTTSETKNGVKLKMENITKPKGFDVDGRSSEFLAPIVEYGVASKGNGAAWQQPRPFMAATENELKKSSLIKDIIKEIDYIK